MRLVDLDPRWVAYDNGLGPPLGLTFLCPHCKTERLGVAFHKHGHEVMDDAVIRAKSPKDKIWNMTGSYANFNLTITPSIDASDVGQWHGFITNGTIS